MSKHAIGWPQYPNEGVARVCSGVQELTLVTVTTGAPPSASHLVVVSITQAVSPVPDVVKVRSTASPTSPRLPEAAADANAWPEAAAHGRSSLQ